MCIGGGDLWYCLVLACCNNKLSRYDAVNHSAKCKYYKYGNIDIVVRTPESGIVLELCFYNIRLLHLIYYTNTNYYFIESFTTKKSILSRLEKELMIFSHSIAVIQYTQKILTETEWPVVGAAWVAVSNCHN